MLSVVEAYIKDKELAWSEKTKLSVESTLRKLAPVLDGDAPKLWAHLKKTQAPYSRVTTWQRVSHFWDFARSKEVNPYREFRTKNKLLFKDQYIRRPAKESMEDALSKIDDLTDPAIKRKALELLYSGMRWAESLTIGQDGFIRGKGGREREVFLPKVPGPLYKGSYRTFLRALKDVGLKPHMLRKIQLTECSNKGATIFELMEIAGWKTLESARSYVGVRRERLKQITEDIRK